MISLIGGAGFYFVPILALMAILNWRELEPGRSKQIYLLIAALMLPAYLLLGNSSRYLLIPLILCAPLAGAGTTMLLRFLRFFRCFDWLKRRYLMLAFTIPAVAVSFLRLSLRNHEDVLFEFESTMRREAAEPVILRSVDCSHGRVLGGLLMYDKAIDFADFESDWPRAIDFLTQQQYNDKPIYFFIRIPKRYTAGDIADWFRGKYGIYPFDIVKQEDDYLLIKFNGKIADGAAPLPAAEALSGLPDELTVEPFRGWVRAPLPETWVRAPETALLLRPENGTADEKYIYFRLENGSAPERGYLNMFNQLGWRLDGRDFQLRTIPGGAVELPLSAGNKVDFQLNDEKPLVLDLPEVYVNTDCQQLYLAGAVPHYRPGSRRFEFSAPDGVADLKKNGSAAVDYTVKDIYRQQSTQIDFTVVRADCRVLKSRPLKILLVEDKISSRLELAEPLQSLLHPDSLLECLPLQSGNENSWHTAAQTHYKSGDFDVVLLNIAADSFARPWSIPLKIGPFMDKYATETVKKLRKKYPEAMIAIILPPPPAPGASMYPFTSPLQSRLAYWHSARALYRWQQRKKHNVSIVPLTLTVDPQAGYVRYSAARPVWEGFKFTPRSRQAMAETVGAFLVNKLYDSR